MQTTMIAPLRRFNLLAGEIDAAYHDAARRLGLADSTQRLLYTLCTVGESCPLGELIRLSGLSKQTVNSAIRQMERDGLAYLTPTDGKKKALHLTDAGRTLCENTIFRIIAIENQIFADWSEAEQAEYLRLTKEFLTAFKTQLSVL